MLKDNYTDHTFKDKWKPLCLFSLKYFGNAQDLLEDLKIVEYQSTREYFIVVAEAFSDASRQRCAKVFDGLKGTYSHNCNYRLMWTCEEQEMTIKAK